MDKVGIGMCAVLIIMIIVLIGQFISGIYFHVQVYNGVYESNVSFCEHLNGEYLSSNSGRGLCVINDLTYQITEQNGCNIVFFQFNCKHKLNGFADKGFSLGE